jgi:hypothetical protein
MYNHFAGQVENERQVLAPLAGTDFINGDVCKISQGRLGEPLDQVSFLDILDGVPARPEQVGHVPHGHFPHKRLGVPLKCRGAPTSGIGDIEVDTPNA